MIQRIQCVADIYDHNKKAANIRVRVQYFDAARNSWINLTPLASFKMSRMQFSTTASNVLSRLTNGNLAAFRLVNSQNTDEIISCGYSIQRRNIPRTNNDELFLDFGTIYYHSPNYLSDLNLKLPPNQHGFRTILVEGKNNKQDALIKTLQTEIRGLRSTNTELSNEIEKLNKLLTNARAELKKLKSGSNDFDEKREVLEKTIKDLERDIDVLNNSKKEKDQQLKRTQNDLIKSSSELKKESSLRVKAEEERDIIRVKLEQLKEEVRISKKNGPANISSIYRHMIEEVEESIPKSKNSRFSIGKVSMNLKGLVVNDSGRERFQLLNAELAKQIRSDVISNVFIEINDTNPSEDHRSFVPNVLGQTETAVRNTLKASDLHLNAVYQSTKSVPVGQAFKQSPAEGDTLPSNSVVTVVFSK